MANFNSRETYLLARQQWKDEYAALSENIRKTRSEVVAANRAFSATNTTDWAKTYTALIKLLSDLGYLRHAATEKINELVEMKAESARQWKEKDAALNWEEKHAAQGLYTLQRPST